MQKAPNGIWVAKRGRQLILTGETDIAEAIAVVMKKAG